MMIGEYYWSTFLTEEHTLEEKLAWIKAYTLYLSETPHRPGWCQKKADDDYGQFISQVTVFEEVLSGIDEEDTKSPDGWWETSTGVEFGKQKLHDLRKAKI